MKLLNHKAKQGVWKTKRKKHSNNVQNENKIKHTIDINITQMMVGKQWVKGRYIYR